MRRTLNIFAFVCASLSAIAARAEGPPAADKPDAPAQTVTIKARRPQAQRTIDSTTYNVKDSATGQAGTAEDVLNNIPSVTAQDGALTVRGNGNVQLYVNGKPSAGGATTLQAMSGSAIASVEVITNPSAKYDANGGAIVNLILKQDADAGLHGTVTANAGDHRRANLAFDGSYGGKNLSANLGVSLRDDVRFQDVLNDRTLISADGQATGHRLRDSLYTPTHSKALNLNGSLLYKLTPASDLGADFTLSHASPKNRVFEHRVDYDPAGDIVAAYDRVRGGTYFGHSGDASIYYQLRGAGAQPSLRIVAQTERNSVRSDRPFVVTPILPAGPETAQRIYIGTFTREQRLSIDYDRPLHGGLRMSAGAELKHDTLRLANGQTEIDPAIADHPGPPPIATVYRAAQTTAAAYFTLEARHGGWTVQAGERAQAVKVDFDGTSGPHPTSPSITGLNHSLSIARDVGSDQLVLKVSRSQQLFDLHDLDPLVTYVDPDTRSIGNPGLRPQQVTSLEAAYNFTKGARSGDLSFYYRAAHDTLADYNVFLPDNVQVGTKRNYGNARSYGVEATLANQLARTLKFSVTGNLFHSALPQLNGDGTGETRAILSYTAQASLDWKPGKADEIHLDTNAQGPTLILQGRKSGSYAVNMVWRHTVSPRLTLSLTGQSLLRRSYVRTILDTPTGHDTGKRLNGARAIFAGLKYKIG